VPLHVIVLLAQEHKVVEQLLLGLQDGQWSEATAPTHERSLSMRVGATSPSRRGDGRSKHLITVSLSFSNDSPSGTP
jgi:hypothetical protein